MQNLECCFKYSLAIFVILAGLAYTLVDAIYQLSDIEPEIDEELQSTVIVDFLGYVPQIIIDYIVDIVMRASFATLLFCCVIWYRLGQTKIDREL